MSLGINTDMETLQAIQSKLKDFNKEDLFDEGSLHFNLLTEIQDLTLTKNSLGGVYAQDTVIYLYHHGDRTPTPTTHEIPFTFFQEERRVLLVVMEKKLLANNIANRLGEALFATTGYIIESNISNTNFIPQKILTSRKFLDVNKLNKN